MESIFTNEGHIVGDGHRGQTTATKESVIGKLVF